MYQETYIGPLILVHSNSHTTKSNIDVSDPGKLRNPEPELHLSVDPEVSLQGGRHVVFTQTLVMNPGTI